MIEADRVQEYCAALPAWATYSVNRGPKSPALEVEFFMFRHRTREQIANPPVQPMRYALPGERPPSARPPGTNDTVIERFDAYAKQMRKAGNHGR